ncbi:SusC/RagA family TonB-linked outer membrane protein [Parabacteroides goldsteinii]|uniref:SusC/RagA family TonB-linked outer membrane protein n=1 Tax=Parabacteroides goldsteinii TaxID=328812 RepID=UPI00101D5B99|nr:TonB-dependent receptor [Parabacteroides goldsteinii]
MKKRVTFLIVLLMVSIFHIYAQQQNISGTVIDKNLNEPVIGASIQIKGTTNGTITDLDGKFAITASKDDILVISYIGYTTQEIKLTGQSSLKIELSEDTQALDEVVVVGFGTQKKVNLTGAVATVDKKVLASRPVTSVSQSLQGAVPGLNLSTADLGGQLGQNMNVNIRGTGTIGKGSKGEPLILIDGMEGNMNNLNPEDVENISVLKDASSSSIYGSRAAFGVIMITTKKGKAGKMQINYNNNVRYSGPTNLPNQLDSYRFANFFNEASINQGGSAIFDEETIGRIQKYMAGELAATTIANGNNWHFHEKANDNVNWWKKHFQWAWSNEHNISLSGGTEKIQYYASGSYLNQNGNLRYGEDNYKRYNATAKVNTQINKYVDFNINTKFVRFDLDNPVYLEEGGLLYHDIARMWPMMPFKDPNGYYMRNGKLNQLADGGRSKTHNDNIYMQGQLVVHPLKGWNIYAEAGMRIINQNKQTNLNPIYEHDVNGNPLALAFSGSYSPGASFARSAYLNSNFYTTSVYTDYTLQLKDHYFKALIGMNTEEYVYRELSAQRPDVISSLVPEISASTGEDKINSSKYNDWSTAGFFGRINYSYKDRYMVEMNVRYDGSSRFLRDQRWNVFPSFSLGWNVARESFFEPISNIINTLKPRVSWGMLGNQNTDSYYPFYLTQSVTANGGNWLMNGGKPTTAGVPGMVSSTLTWEKIYNTNIGIDLGMLDNRLNATAEYFIRRTKDMVGPAAEVGAILGTSLPNTNNAELKNKGWEIQLNWRDQIGKVNYNAGFNLSDYRAKVISYPNASKALWDADGNTLYYDGMTIGEIWGYETEGIAKSDEQMTEWLANNDQSKIGSAWGAGDIMYRDLNGDKVVDSGNSTAIDHGDLKVIGNSTPRFRFGLSLGADWKGFDIQMFFQGVMKRDIWLGGPMFWGADGGEWQSVGFSEHLDYFRPENTASVFGANLDSYYPKAYLGDKGNKNKKTQTRYLQNGAYMRMKNLQIGYTFPRAWMNKANIQKLRIYVSAENLFTISGIADMFDPEATAANGFSNGKTYPLSKTISFGLNITL